MFFPCAESIRPRREESEFEMRSATYSQSPTWVPRGERSIVPLCRGLEFRREEKSAVPGPLKALKNQNWRSV